MAKISYKQVKWEEIEGNKKAEFRMLFYSSMRLVSRLERKIVQMAEVYKSLDKSAKNKDKS